MGIYPFFNEWWSPSSVKLMYMDGISFPAFVTNMAGVVFHLDDPCADIRQLPLHSMVVMILDNLWNANGFGALQFPKFGVLL